MTVDRERAFGESKYGDRTFSFCSSACLEKFEQSPARYAMDEPRGRGEAFEKHEPPHTTIGGVPLPKFGSAGAGGLEREPGPETHVKDPTHNRKP
jgi:YHS domain-containing protein